MNPTRSHLGLSADQAAFFQDNGYLMIRRVFTAEECARLREESHQLVERLQNADVRMSSRGWPSSAKVTEQPRELYSCHNVQFHSAAFTRLLTDPRFTEPAAGLIGPNVQLHHTKMFIKPPETGAPFPMHQDVPYFPHAKHSMIAAVIHFDDAPLEKGCFRVLPGSHKQGAQPHIEEGNHHLEVTEYPIEDGTPCPAEAGDVLFFSYLTIHGSGTNGSSEARTTLLVQMRDPEDLPVEDTHVSRGQGMMLRGIDPLANSGPGVQSPRRILTADA